MADRDALLARLAQLLPRLNAQDASSAAWALAVLGAHTAAAHLVRPLADAVSRAAPGMQPRQLASAMWGLSKLAKRGGLGPNAFAALHAALPGAVAGAGPQELMVMVVTAARWGMCGAPAAAAGLLSAAAPTLARAAPHLDAHS
eukprot:301552-Chlamydomonas_euryale.AAC.1